MLMNRARCLSLMKLAFLAVPALGLKPNREELARSHAWTRAKLAGAVISRPSAVGLTVQHNYGPVQQNGRDGAPLTIGDAPFTHGLYCHANSRICVSLPGPARSFSAQVGIDTNGTWYGGTAVFAVAAGDKVICTSDVCRRDEAPRPLHADLDGASEFTLVVRDGGDNINSDQADWANAVVTMADGKEIRIGDLPLLPGGSVELDTSAPFSFRYGGRPFSEIVKTWQVSRTSRTLDEARTEYVAIWSDPHTGLIVRCVGIEYHSFPTVEWTLYFRNNGATDTPIIDTIQAVDTTFSSRAQTDCILHHHTGDVCTADSYAPHADPMPVGTAKAFASVGGRPTHTAFPYFNVSWPDHGVTVVLSWAGQWAAQFTRDEAMEMHVRGGQELTHFRLHPGEEVRSPMVVVQFYKGDWLRGQNLWRQWMVEHSLPRSGRKLVEPMASLCTGNYYPGLMSNAVQELLFLRKHVEHHLLQTESVK